MIGGAAGSSDPGRANPRAFTAGDKVLPHPAMETKPGDDPKGEPVLGGGGFAADRETQMKGDYSTEADPTLHYASVLHQPRTSCRSSGCRRSMASARTSAAIVAHGVITELPVGGTTDKTRDRFWGSMLIDLKPGADVPLPSVAPDMRVLSYEIKPNVRLRFEKDGADNFYVRTDEPHATGTYRLVFLCDADAGYFAPQLPAHRMTPALVAAATPPELAHRRSPRRSGADAEDHAPATSASIPTWILRRRVPTSSSASSAASRLKAACRRPATSIAILCDMPGRACVPPPLDSFATFMITAERARHPDALRVERGARVRRGLVPRARLWAAHRSWSARAALKLEVTGADDKTLHRPRAEDPFAKPDAYKNNYTQLEGDIKGLSSRQIADKRKSLSDQLAAVRRPGVRSGRQGRGGTGGGGMALAADDGEGTGDRILPDPNLPAAQIDPLKPTPRLLVTTSSPSAYRGDSLHIEGRVDVAGKGLPDHRVDIFLAPAGSGGAHSKPLGNAVTGPDGSFRVDLQVPDNVEARDTYEIRCRMAGRRDRQRRAVDGQRDSPTAMRRADRGAGDELARRHPVRPLVTATQLPCGRHVLCASTSSCSALAYSKSA